MRARRECLTACVLQAFVITFNWNLIKELFDMKQITKIVMTGGPAGGKTTLTTRLVKDLSARGIRVIIAPEAATELISGFGIKPFGDCLSMYDFQFFVIESQLQKERMAARAAELVPEDRVLIICDRGVLDNKAYVSNEEFATILDHFSLTEKEVLGSYDAVIHLVSSAFGAEYAYSYNNAARYETLEGAREKEEQALLCWQKHPHRVIIGNSYNFENKIRKAMNEIYDVLGEIPPTQCERKYLIRFTDPSLLSAYEPVEQVITQSYLLSRNDDIERRARKVEDRGNISYYFIEKQSVSPFERIEKERILTRKEYLRAIRDVDPAFGSVTKHRYSFKYRDLYMTVDTYASSPDLAILDVQLPDLQQEVDLPPEIEVVRDVTEEERYQGHMISKFMGQLN